MGTDAFSPQRPEPFRPILLLPSPSAIYHGRNPTKPRVSLGAGAAQLQASGLRVRSHAGACSPPAQRTTTGDAGRCAEVEAPSGRLSPLPKSGVKSRDLEARSIAAFNWRCGSFLAKEVLRFQYSKLPAVCGKAALYPSKSGQAGLVRTSGGLGREQLSPLRVSRDGSCRNRIGMDSAGSGNESLRRVSASVPRRPRLARKSRANLGHPHPARQRMQITGPIFSK